MTVINVVNFGHEHIPMVVVVQNGVRFKQVTFRVCSYTLSAMNTMIFTYIAVSRSQDTNYFHHPSGISKFIMNIRKSDILKRHIPQVQIQNAVAYFYRTILHSTAYPRNDYPILRHNIPPEIQQGFRRHRAQIQSWFFALCGRPVRQSLPKEMGLCGEIEVDKRSLKHLFASNLWMNLWTILWSLWRGCVCYQHTCGPVKPSVGVQRRYMAT